MSMCVCAMCIPLWQLFKIVEQIKSNKQRSSCRKNNPFILHLKLHSLDVKATPSRYCCFRRGVDLSEWCLYHGRWDYYIDIYIYLISMGEVIPCHDPMSKHITQPPIDLYFNDRSCFLHKIQNLHITKLN